MLEEARRPDAVLPHLRRELVQAELLEGDLLKRMSSKELDEWQLRILKALYSETERKKAMLEWEVAQAELELISKRVKELS